MERRLGRVVGEVEARVRQCEVKANKRNDEDGEGNENERRRLVEEGSSSYICLVYTVLTPGWWRCLPL